jgi:hypothetical protein
MTNFNTLFTITWPLDMNEFIQFSEHGDEIRQQRLNKQHELTTAGKTDGTANRTYPSKDVSVLTRHFIDEASAQEYATFIVEQAKQYNIPAPTITITTV